MSLLEKYRARKAREAKAKAKAAAKARQTLPEPTNIIPPKMKPPKPPPRPRHKSKKAKATEEAEAEWRAEWVGMPEFLQEKREPFTKVIIRFETEEDLDEFSEMIGQKLTPRTKSIWHPKLLRGEHSHLVWIDPSEEQEEQEERA